MLRVATECTEVFPLEEERLGAIGVHHLDVGGSCVGADNDEWPNLHSGAALDHGLTPWAQLSQDGHWSREGSL